jgi:hypothetical protein
MEVVMTSTKTEPTKPTESPLLLGYPGKPLGPQVRPFDTTHSAFAVLRDAFFPDEARK